MIRVIIERQVKKGENFLTLLRQIRTEAMKQPGYITGETLVNADDHSNIIVISTWQSLKDWKAWEKSERRAKLEHQIDAHLVEAPKVRAYRYLSYKESAGQG